MSQKKEFDDIFDDDFEVTYEEDPVYDEDDFDNGKFYETDDSDEDDSEENYFEEEYPGDEYPDEAAENEYDDAIYSPSDRKRKKRHPSEEEPEYETGKRSDPRSRKRSGVPLAAPIKKGGKALSRLTGFLLQQLSVLLILATTIFVLYNFWRASTPYGDIQESIRKKSISQTRERERTNHKRRYWKRSFFLSSGIYHVLPLLFIQSFSSRQSGDHLWHQRCFRCIRFSP